MKFGIVIHMSKVCWSFFSTILFMVFTNSVLGQNRSDAEALNWQGVTKVEYSSEVSIDLLSFEGAAYVPHLHHNPVYFHQEELSGNPARMSAQLINPSFEPLTSEELAVIDTEVLSNQVQIETSIGRTRGRSIGEASFVPLIINSSGQVEKLMSFELRLNYSGSQASPQRQSRTTSSVMAGGEWHRIGVAKDGIYRMDYDFLSSIGLDIDNINPDQINVFGNGVGLLPRENSIERPEDLQANAIQIVGGEDGSFDPGDYILFFAKGPHRWEYSDQHDEFRHIKHLYTDTSFYFIGLDAAPPKRINTVSSVAQPPNQNVSVFDDYMFHELDLENLLKSGRTWMGEVFDIQTTRNFSGDAFTFPNIRTDETAKVRVELYARSLGSSTSSDFDVQVIGQASENVVINGVNPTYTSIFANKGAERLDFLPNSSTFDIQIDYNKNASTSKGWLDFISINVRRNLIMQGNQMTFRDRQSVGSGNIAEFTLGGASGVRRIWDVTDPTNAQAIDYGPDAGTISFRRPASGLREYIAATNSGFPTPTYFGSVPNQDLHALGTQVPVDMIIVTHPKFYNSAMELASFHSNHPLSPVYTEVVTNQQVYNEFSSGMPDITAIKDLMRMLYERANGLEEEMPRYLLLFGDGSYDNRSKASSNTNYVLTYQSENSTSPTGSYTSDDYFGLLDPSEGESTTDKMDIGVGRLTVKTPQEADAVVKKIFNYMTPDFSADAAHCSGVGNNQFGEWRNRVVFVADDEDNNIHMRDANEYAETVEEDYPDFNVVRIFLDAYQQTSTPGGDRYPEANDLIRENVERGALLMQYVGHGGEVGWAHERILDVSTIRNWSNFNALPLFMTATCEFTRFDDPGRTSAGEYVLLNPNGAGVSLLSTTRLVFSSQNHILAKSFYNYMFEHTEIENLRLGDITKNTKIGAQSSVNKRSFMLIGDPALRLAYPEMKVYTSSITDTLDVPIDTLKALGNIKVSGYVGDRNGSLLSNFNGVVTVTVFDKKSEITTLTNDGGTPFSFSTHKNIIYRGKAGVTNGQFELSFIVPKDINLAVDTTGRISYYAVSDQYDAHGHSNNLTIGGIDENAAEDDTGPQVEIFMNDENFVMGGMTDENPVIFAKLFDDSGINMVGTGIGHDLSAVLNEDNANALILNDYYESDLDTYKSGTIRYQLNDLEEGLHKLSLKAWDVHNNSSDGYTEFIVAESEEFVLSHVLNYPNPFTTHTEFSFEHNQVCTFLNVQIQVFTISGKLVKTINTVSNTDGFRVEPIAWNGRDDYGDQLARGVYVYKIKVRNPAGEKVEQFEKLVILK